MTNTLLFASKNKHKIDEIHSMLPKHIELLSLNELQINDEIPEDYDNFYENAKQKVDFILQKKKMNVFADDSGLEVECLNREPGVYTARYAKVNHSNLSNLDFLLEKMKNFSNRKARFICCIVLFWENEYFRFDGVVEGKIAFEIKGNMGFAYDPVFIPDGSTLTFAEMTEEEKNKISHRFLAVSQMIHFLEKKIISKG